MLRVLGIDGKEHPIIIGPEHVVGDFYFPVHDGTLPIDRIAMVDVWRELMTGVAQDQELRQTFSLPKMFEHAAELAGAKNIESFKLQQGDQPPQMNFNAQPEEQIQQGVQKGNLIPVDFTGGNRGPGRRLAGATNV